METLEDSKITTENLCKLLEGSQAVLLLDLRSFMLYNQAHAKQALNVCIPKTLAKRQGFTVESISAGICKKADKDEFKKRKGAVVVLYDQNGTDRDPCSLFCKCFDALLRESLCMKVYWLEGGFTRLQNQAPELIRTSKVSTILKPLTSPKSTRPLFPPLAAMTAPADLSAQNETIVQITDHLFLSGSHIAEDYETLKAHNIRYIINAAVEIRNCFGNLRDFVYKRLDLQDHPAQHMCFVEVFESAFKAIDEAKANNVCALVHCRGGRSRSATIVIAYLMKSYNWTLQQAYGYVQAKHPKVSPNLGFMGQLINYEAFLRGIRGDLAHNRSPMKIVESPFQIQYLGSPQEGHPPARSHSPSTAEAITSMSSVTLDVQS